MSYVFFPQFQITEDFFRDSEILANDAAQFGRSISTFQEPLTRSVLEVIIPSIQTNFAVEGRPTWDDLELSTVKRRRASGPILDRTGKLKRAASSFGIWTITDNSAAITGLDNLVKYARYHQGGTGHMVPRPFVMYQAEDEEAIEEVFGQWVDDQAERTGFFTGVAGRVRGFFRRFGR
jgi:phage gpG-like protein